MIYSNNFEDNIYDHNNKDTNYDNNKNDESDNNFLYVSAKSTILILDQCVLDGCCNCGVFGNQEL